MTSKGAFIIAYLKPRSPEGDYILSMYEAWCRFKPVKPGSYKNFRGAIKVEKEKGTIEHYKTVPNAVPGRFALHYYRVTPYGAMQ